MIKIQNKKQKQASTINHFVFFACFAGICFRFGHLYFGHLNLFRISDFVLRIYLLPGSGLSGLCEEVVPGFFIFSAYMDVYFQGEFGDMPGKFAIQVVFNGKIPMGYFA
jgi:hypothetical protein